jgi:hypothetical protein
MSTFRYLIFFGLLLLVATGCVNVLSSRVQAIGTTAILTDQTPEDLEKLKPGDQILVWTKECISSSNQVVFGIWFSLRPYGDTIGTSQKVTVVNIEHQAIEVQNADGCNFRILKQGMTFQHSGSHFLAMPLQVVAIPCDLVITIVGTVVVTPFVICTQ